MLREDYAWITDVTKRFHDRSGFYPDREEVIRQIRVYRRTYLMPGKKGWNRYAVAKRAVERFAMTEAIRKLNERPDEDPIWVLNAFRSNVDGILTESEHGKTWVFTQHVYRAIEDLLEYLE